MEEHYDVIIVGCGPAGLDTGLYTNRRSYKVIILGNHAVAGSIWVIPVTGGSLCTWS